MQNLEDYDLSEIFGEMYEAAGQAAEGHDATTSGEQGETDDEGVLTPSEETWDEDAEEDIGYDEDYSDIDNHQYTPGDSPILGNNGVTDTTLLPQHGQRDQERVIQTEASASSAMPRDSISNDSPPESHRSGLPSYLTGLTQIALSADYAQRRRGSTPALANDDRAEEDPSSDNTTEYEPARYTPDSNSPARRHSTPGVPSVVDFVAELRAIVGNEWNRVHGNDPDCIPNPYDSVEDWDSPHDWDWVAFQNYTRFPHFRWQPAPS
ncbi:uncharacterized protein N0V89_009232 [Didymosphaeria variabile]|uniref:Uncharacterized protein n=1 Tax=Didymosphaeria variabile TaxID=1932322 RepID=A0A9W9C6D2_9PLEO|nr:uncharacterized protein N0V89_009232 [Didymosphaeria variabile]KAJ4347862.1 hypothetical protein N0V89_009232 [Didymosphaeria variabile]